MRKNCYKSMQPLILQKTIIMFFSTLFIGCISSFILGLISSKLVYADIMTLIIIGASIFLGMIFQKIIKSLEYSHRSSIIIAFLIGIIVSVYFFFTCYNYFYLLFNTNDNISLFSLFFNPMKLKDGFKTIINDQNQAVLIAKIILSSKSANSISLIIMWLIQTISLIIFPIIFINKQLNVPFIVFENKWANLYDSNNLNFANIDLNTYSEMILINPESLLEFPTVNYIHGTDDHIGISIYHSRYFDDCFMNIIQYTVNFRNSYSKKCLLRNVIVSRDFVIKLFNHCRTPLPYTLEEIYELSLIDEKCNNANA